MRERTPGAREQLNTPDQRREPLLAGFSSLVGQQRPVRLLRAVLASGHLPNALLFTGIEGTGKKTAALTFAQACNCQTLGLFSDPGPEPPLPLEAIEPCGRCRACRKILSDAHPDLIRVKPDGEMIKVDQVRALCGILARKPREAARRVVIISDAHKFNTEAANTLLKTLEEPPDHTLFILTARQAADILPTIVSRCQQVRFNPISRPVLESWLVSRMSCPAPEARVIAAMAGGSLVQAERMAQKDWMNRRNWVLGEMEALPSGSVADCLAFAETLAKRKDGVQSAFEIMKNWLRDIALYPAHPDNLILTDRAAAIAEASRRIPPETLIRRFKAIEKAERDIKANANLRITLEALILFLAKGQ